MLGLGRWLEVWRAPPHLWRAVLWLYALGDIWHVTCDMWQVTHDMWHITHDMWHVTHYMWLVIHDTWFFFHKKCQKIQKPKTKIAETCKNCQKKVTNSAVKCHKKAAGHSVGAIIGTCQESQCLPYVQFLSRPLKPLKLVSTKGFIKSLNIDTFWTSSI